MPRPRKTDPIRVGEHVTIYPPDPNKSGKQATMHRIAWTRPDGDRRSRWRVDRHDALEVATELDRQLVRMWSGRPGQDPDDVAATRTVSDLCDHWLDPATHEEPWSIHHERNCRSVVEVWIRPALGHHRLADVDDMTLRRFLEDVRARQPKSVRRIGVALSGMFGLAVVSRWRKDNPMAGVKYGTRKRRQGVSNLYVPLSRRPSSDAVERLARSFDRLWPDERLGDAVLLAAYSGIRKGELFALTDRDVEFMDGGARLDVLRQRIDDDGGHVHEPKYQKIRETFVPDFVADRLANRLTWNLPAARRFGCADRSCPDMVGTGGRLLFPTIQSRSWWTSSNFDRRRFTPAKAGAPVDTGTEDERPWPWTWHDLRHHFCTWALAPAHAGGRGLEVADVSYFAGHETPEFTMKAYVAPREGAVTRALTNAG